MKYVRNVFLFQKFQLKKPCKRHADWLCKFTKLEQDIDNEEKFEEYDKTRSELEKIFDKIAESVKIGCKWVLWAREEKCNMSNYKNVNKCWKRNNHAS